MILTAVCDLAFCPVSFDFVTWLVRAMKARDEQECTGLHVVLLPKEDGFAGFAREWGRHDEAATQWRLWHIVMASVPLARATVTLAPDRGHAERAWQGAARLWMPKGKAHFMGPLVEASRRSESIPKLRATDAARRYIAEWLRKDRSEKPLVTLTTRNQTTDADRNSHPVAWAHFEAWLKEQGMRPIVLSDTHVALGDGRGHAELDPDLRLALYEHAKMNLIGNNGPQELLKFSDAPYLAFCQALTPGWKDHFEKYFGMKVGDQLPWARADQRLVYRRDDFEILKDEFQKWAWASQGR